MKECPEVTRPYYESERHDLIKFIPSDAARVLDVGCGAGMLGKRLKASRSKKIEVTGIEMDRAAAKAAESNIDRVITGNIETQELNLPKGYFDCIIYGDVLEHLADPLALLLKFSPFLNKDGLVIASIPNIAHYRILKMLKRKEWNYSDAGILDRTHLRFFTLKTIKEMFSKARLNIITIENKISASRLKKVLNRILFGALTDSITEQYIVVAKSKHVI